MGKKFGIAFIIDDESNSGKKAIILAMSQFL